MVLDQSFTLVNTSMELTWRLRISFPACKTNEVYFLSPYMLQFVLPSSNLSSNIDSKDSQVVK